MDESWNDLLTEFIPKILQANDKQSFEMTICEMTAHLHDGHTGLVNPQVLYDIFGSYRAPVNLTRTKEGQWVVCDLFWDCPLQVGDVILKLDGMDIKEVEESRKKYISVPNDEKVYNALFLYLTSKDEEIEVTVLRSGKEETYTVKGTTGYQYALKRSNTSHEILNGNIGLINPSVLPQGDTQTVIGQVMDDLRDTDGLIVDLRQYPSDGMMSVFLTRYFQMQGRIYSVLTTPSQSIPGTFLKQNIVSWGAGDGAFYYGKPVVILINEESISNSEWSAMGLRNGDNVVMLGSNSIGADGNVVMLPLPHGNQLRFSGFGIYTPEMGQTQRVGLSPDIEVHPTIEGIKKGRDELMEAAVAYLTETKDKQ